jgi:transposase
MDGVKEQARPKLDWQQQYRELEQRHARFLKRYDELMLERQWYRRQAYDLAAELKVVRRESYQEGRRSERLEAQLEKQRAENAFLKRQLAAVKAPLDRQTSATPAFVKANTKKQGKKRPGRKAGHAAALRPLPKQIDHHIEVPGEKDASGACCCSHCHTQLQDVKRHERLVEDIVPAKALVQCYHTISGYCPSCRKRIETRAAQQPPAAELPHGQIGLNALALAVLLRAVYRLPFEPLAQLLADLPGIRVSTGAIAKQIQRAAGLLKKEHQRLGIYLKLAPAVHMDETSWRVDGRNYWLWTLLDERHTLFHMDQSRGSQVVKKLLGEVFGGVLVSDFYAAYGQIDCRKQKCLVHLLRELKETAKKSDLFASGPLYRRLKRLLKEMLLLKKQKGALDAGRYQAKGQRLEERLKALAARSYGEAEADRLAKRLRKHEQELTVFLWQDGVAGDNNAAERALRPAVVLRKISGGSRSERGAQATAILLSIARTIRQQNLPMLETFKSMLMAAWANQPPGLLTDTPAQAS